MGKEAAFRPGFRGFKGWWWRPGGADFKGKRHRCRRRLCRMVMFALLKGKVS